MQPADTHIQFMDLSDILVVTFRDPALLDPMGVRAVQEELLRLVERSGMNTMIIDFGGVQTLSSQMLSVLVRLRERMQTARKRLLLCHLQTRLVEVFEVTSLKHMFELFPTRASAIAAART